MFIVAEQVSENRIIFTPGEILEEFDYEGRKAQVKVLEPSDVKEGDFEELSVNLTNTNFALLEDVKLGGVRSGIRSVVHQVRSRLAEESKAGKLLDTVKDSVYPDFARSEHEKAYAKKYKKALEEGEILGVVVDGRTVAVQIYRRLGETSEGQAVYELGKGSTLKEYSQRGLNKKLKKQLCSRIAEANPGLIWVGASRNKPHLKNLEQRGWHRVPMDDSNEAVRMMNGYSPETGEICDYAKMMKDKQGFEAFYWNEKSDANIFSEEVRG